MLIHANIIKYPILRSEDIFSQVHAIVHPFPSERAVDWSQCASASGPLTAARASQVNSWSLPETDETDRNESDSSVLMRNEDGIR